MKTGCFFTATGPGRISIARYAPPKFRSLPRFPALAPGAWFKSVSQEEYVKRYIAQLAQLDAREVWDKLHALVAPHDPILLCWESALKFCHRRLAAEWMYRKLGTRVDEVVL